MENSSRQKAAPRQYPRRTELRSQACPPDQRRIATPDGSLCGVRNTRTRPLKRHHAADRLAALNQLECVVDLGERHHMRDHRVDLDLALHVPVTIFGTVALISTSTSPSRGPVVTSSGFPAAVATAARTSIAIPRFSVFRCCHVMAREGP